jgi:hypothetical protein
MSAAGRSALTLAILVGIVLVWLVWGISAATKPFPGKASAPTCVDVTIPGGTRVSPADVTVSVLNGGTREGLAGRTMQLFLDQGFAKGDSANVPEGTKVAVAQIWTNDPTSPAVKLVASRIAGVKVVDTPSTAAGITVVVGDDFTALVAGKKSSKSKADSVVCGPSV